MAVTNGVHTLSSWGLHDGPYLKYALIVAVIVVEFIQQQSKD